MPWAQYNLSDGFINGTNSQQVSDSDLAALGRAQLYFEDIANPHDYFVDTSQDPPVMALVPVS